MSRFSLLGLLLFGLFFSSCSDIAPETQVSITPAQIRDSIIRKNKEDFAAFLIENAKNEAVVVLEEGKLQYQVIEKAKGRKPTPNSFVTVHYTGKLLDRTVFDSSEERGEPAKFKVSQVIIGWQKALLHMHKGEKCRVFIASDLAYGDEGAGKIPGGAGLIFDIHLLDVE